MLGSIISKFDAEAKSHMERQSLNPFSGSFSRSPSPRLSKDQYGRPLAGSKTEERGQRAKCHILREILDLCNCIHDLGIYNRSHRPHEDSDDEEPHDDEIIVSFGEIFQMYTKINDKVVGLLIAAKKRGYLYFEKEILFQRRDDDVLIALIKPIAEIRGIINKELAANASPVPFHSREVSPAVGENSDRESPKVSPEKDEVVKAPESLQNPKEGESSSLQSESLNAAPEPISLEVSTDVNVKDKNDEEKIANIEGEQNTDNTVDNKIIKQENEEDYQASHPLEIPPPESYEKTDSEQQQIPRLEITFEEEPLEENEKLNINPILDKSPSEVASIDVVTDHTSAETKKTSSELAEIEVTNSHPTSVLPHSEEMKENEQVSEQQTSVLEAATETSADETCEIDEKGSREIEQVLSERPQSSSEVVSELVSNEEASLPDVDCKKHEQVNFERAKSPVVSTSLTPTNNFTIINDSLECEHVDSDTPNSPNNTSRQTPIGEIMIEAIENEKVTLETLANQNKPVDESQIRQTIEDITNINLDEIKLGSLISNGVEIQTNTEESEGLDYRLDVSIDERLKLDESPSVHDLITSEKVISTAEEATSFQNTIANLASTLSDRSPSPDPCDEEVQQILESHISSVPPIIDSSFQEERFYNDPDMSA